MFKLRFNFFVQQTNKRDQNVYEQVQTGLFQSANIP